MTKRILCSTVLLFFIFLLINILGSLLPMGVGAVESLKMETHQIDELNLEESSMKLLLTNDRMNFISSRPFSYYSLDKFYGRNTLLSLLSAFLLSIILYMLQDLEVRKRLLICSVFGLLIITSVHMSYWNWWGFSNLYSIGVSLSSFVTLFISCLVSNYLIFKPHRKVKINL